MNNLNGENYEGKAIELTVSGLSGSYGEPVLLPVEENLEKAGVGTFFELKKLWESQTWSYYGKAKVELVSIFRSEYEANLQLSFDFFAGFGDDRIVKNEVETAVCNEFDVIGFKEKMIESEFYNSPFDSEARQGEYYVSNDAYDAYFGQVYSKDFAYFTCVNCNRSICEQNPKNGYMIQYKIIFDCEQICLKCFELDMFENGVDLDEVLEGQTLKSGSFFSDSELSENGFSPVESFQNELVGMGQIGSRSEKDFFSKMGKVIDGEGLRDKDAVIINYESMAIGGLGGYVSLWAK